jgi:rhodanese-related sulfurtransferase
MKAGLILRESSTVLLISIALGLVYSSTVKIRLFASHTTAVNDSPTTREVVPAPVKISLEDVHRYIRDGNATFLDARHEAEYSQGHIGNALNIPINDFEGHAQLLTTLPKDALLITYCDGSGCNASIELAARLTALGYRNVKIFYGGWQEWESSTLPAEH